MSSRTESAGAPWFIRAVGLVALGLVVLPLSLLVLNSRLYSAPVVRVVEVPLKNLPPALDGFTILQITDLHGSEFGPKQSEIRRLLRGRMYDAVVLTGDYLDVYRPSAQPILDLVDALPAKRPFFFVLTGQDYVRSGPGQPDQLAPALAARGGVDLQKTGPGRVTRSGASVWFLLPAYSTNDARLRTHSGSTGPSDTRIVVAHDYGVSLDVAGSQRKMDDGVLDEFRRVDWGQYLGPGQAEKTVTDFDLAIYGHTHAGQIRLPLLGAVYARGLGFRPRQEYAWGLRQEGGRSAYVGAGLGAQSAFKDRSPVDILLTRRFWNPPELALIRLVRRGD